MQGPIQSRRDISRCLSLLHCNTGANLRSRGATLICPLSVRGHGSEHCWKRRGVVTGPWSVCIVLRRGRLTIHGPLHLAGWITRDAVYHGTVSHSSRESHLVRDRPLFAATRRGEVRRL
ncbi:hypothetical protein M758_UG255000 [Ceratodon purpureus]|nr:hypothetical protein M758_UG255000 [Ceratodon purpureus]